MKKYLLLLLLVAMPFSVMADQRFENWQGICHFNYDANNDDNEVYFSNCKNTIDTYDDGNGTLAFGSSSVKETYIVEKNTYPKGLVDGNVFLKGNASTAGDKYEVSNTTCVMVTSNYNADADDNNETVYTTNDWELEMIAKDKHNKRRDNHNMKVAFDLNCRNGVAQ